MDNIRAVIRVAKKHYPDLPLTEDELVRLVITESSGNPNAQSPKNAYGLFQLRIPTARETATRLRTRFPRLFASIKPEQINPQWIMQNPTKAAFIALEYLSQIYNRINTHPRYTNLSPYEKKTLTLMGYLAGPNRDLIRMAQTPLGKQYATRILGKPPQPETPKRGIMSSRGGNPNRMEKKLADFLSTHYGPGGYTVQKTTDGYRITAKDPNANKPALVIRIQKDQQGKETRSLFVEGDQNPIGQLQFKAGSHFISPAIEQKLTQRFSISPDGETKLREPLTNGSNQQPPARQNPSLIGFYDPLQLYQRSEPTPPTPPAPKQPTPESDKKETTSESAKKTNPMDTFWNNLANVLPMMLLMLAMNPARGGDDYA